MVITAGPSINIVDSCPDRHSQHRTVDHDGIATIIPDVMMICSATSNLILENIIMEESVPVIPGNPSGLAWLAGIQAKRTESPGKKTGHVNVLVNIYTTQEGERRRIIRLRFAA